MNLEEKAEVYEKLVGMSRQIVNKCSKAIGAFHRGGTEDLPDEMVNEMMQIMRDSPEMWAHAEGAVRVAFQEYAEAKVLMEVVGQALEKFAEAKVLQEALDKGQLAKLDLPEGTYLLGVCDAIGELKRYFLERMIEKKYDEAKQVLEVAKTLFDYVSGFNYPDAMARGFRKKKDVARNILNSMLMVYAEKGA